MSKSSGTGLGLYVTRMKKILLIDDDETPYCDSRTSSFSQVVASGFSQLSRVEINVQRSWVSMR